MIAIAAPQAETLPKAIQDRQSLMRALEILGQEVDIAHRCADVRVTENAGEPHHFPSRPEVFGAERVAQPVKA
jgi:hypothetical protein